MSDDASRWFDEVPAERDEPRPAGPRSGRATLREARVLVVDDEPDARELLATVLENAGAEVLQASSVSSAMSILGEHEVSAVVSDIGMPGEDGYTFVRRLRAAERTKELPAIALTAYARAEDRERALASGFGVHMPKPIEPARLVAIVAAMLVR